ncbi:MULTISPECIES: YlmH family RNA-binding protein [Bacillus]|uniref:YlmH family RNA-binding protein n=1 Tax=Bacillus TaxID=1386 RepID=UPI000BB6B9BB|nr:MULTISPECIES: RNA-binding protein [Bacillus]
MSIYQHFRKEEHEFIDKIVSWKEYVQRVYTSKLTDFLDPREQEILSSIIGQNGEVQFILNGGHPNAERKRAFIFPHYIVPNEEDFQLKAFEIQYAQKFVKIDHRHVLGALMNIGLKRSKYGDISIAGKDVFIVVSTEIADFVKMELNEVGKATVTLKDIPTKQVKLDVEKWEEASTTASSLRIDTIIASVYNISRQKAQILIEGQKVKVNWKLIDQTSFDCEEGDVISVRGFGRSKLVSVDGKTKKDKYRIIVGKQK